MVLPAQDGVVQCVQKQPKPCAIKNQELPSLLRVATANKPASPTLPTRSDLIIFYRKRSEPLLFAWFLMVKRK
jgi:hypothetical protein